MQQPQQKRHKLLTIAKPNKQNSGPNKKKTLKTAAGYKSAMAVGVVLGGSTGYLLGWGYGDFWVAKTPRGPLHRPIRIPIQSNTHTLQSEPPAA